jgi:hypothetical protein
LRSIWSCDDTGLRNGLKIHRNYFDNIIIIIIIIIAVVVATAAAAAVMV